MEAGGFELKQNALSAHFEVSKSTFLKLYFKGNK